MLIYIALCLFVVLLVYTFLNRVNQYWKKLKVPHVKPWPLLGNFGAFTFRQKSLADLSQDFYNAYYKSRYVGFQFYLTPILMIRDLDLIKDLGIKDFDHFVDHWTLATADSDPLLAQNLFSLKGQKWRHMRSTLSPAFTGSKMRAMFTLMSDCAEQFTSHFMLLVDPHEPLTLEMKDTFTRYANDVIATTAFGVQCDSLKEKDNEFYLMGKDATNFGGLRTLKILGYVISKTLMKMLRFQVFSKEASNFFRNLVVTNIATREREGIVRPDMIHLLMEARKGLLKHDENTKSEGAGFATVDESHVGKEISQSGLELTDDVITAQAILFFFGGFDTISTALCHTTYELALNEDIQEKLQREIDATLANFNGKFTYEAILKMKYLDMVLSEGLRKWPTFATIDRVCVDSFVIQPETADDVAVPLKKGDCVWFPIYAIHRDPKYYPNPEKFDPERFSDENKEKIRPYSYLPFGIGPRNCIGSRFALLEVKTILCHVLSKFSFVIVEKSEVPITISRTQFNMNAENGFWLGLKRRNNQ